MKFGKVLICGCARSGNTLLLHLMSHGFAHTKILHGEQLPHDEPYVTVIGKRPLELDNLEIHVRHMGIVLMMRHPKDTLLSIRDPIKAKPHVKPTRWIEAALQIAKYEHRPHTLLVYYEQLIRYPHAIQEQLSTFLDLPLAMPFEECYHYFDSNDTKNVEAMHGIRALDHTRVFAWKNQPDQQEYLDLIYTKYPRLTELECYFYQNRLAYL